jgi:choline dehydrogenase-like flavoprotein
MLTYRLVGDKGINHKLHGLGLAKSLAQYLAFRTGPLSNGAMEVGAFIKTDPAQPRTNAQLYISGWTLHIPESRSKDTVAPMQSVEHDPGMTITTQLVGLESEAALEIMSADPDAGLRITPNWLGTEKDQRAAIDLVRYVRRFVTQPAIAPMIGEEISPGSQYQSDAEILGAVRTNAICGTHAVRSCRMGRDEGSVVDERLRVRGVHGLRVVDCSVMPALISGNTNAPAMATGWRAADLILEDARVRNAA